MSIRVHELAKKIGRDNKETIEILKKYSIDAKSVSATVDNITAAAVVEEYSVEPEAAKTEETPSKVKEAPEEDGFTSRSVCEICSSSRGGTQGKGRSKT